MMTKVCLLAALAALCLAGTAALADNEELQKLLASYMADAKVGEWALYNYTGGGTCKEIVTRVTEEMLFVRTIIADDSGAVLQDEVIEYPLDPSKVSEYSSPSYEFSYYKEIIQFQGRDLEVVVETKKMREYVDKNFYANEAPVRGLVYALSDDKIVMTLADYGTE